MQQCTFPFHTRYCCARLLLRLLLINKVVIFSVFLLFFYSFYLFLLSSAQTSYRHSSSCIFYVSLLFTISCFHLCFLSAARTSSSRQPSTRWTWRTQTSRCSSTTSSPGAVPSREFYFVVIVFFCVLCFHVL